MVPWGSMVSVDGFQIHIYNELNKFRPGVAEVMVVWWAMAKWRTPHSQKVFICNRMGDVS